jgi:hypothetical protein
VFRPLRIGLTVAAALAALCLAGCGGGNAEPAQLSAFHTVGEQISTKTQELTDEFKASDAKQPGCFLLKQVVDRRLGTDPESIEEFILGQLVQGVQKPEGQYRHKAEEIGDALIEAESGSAPQQRAALKAACS